MSNTSIQKLKSTFEQIRSFPDYEFAKSMPSEFYTSSEYTEHEKKFLAGEWQCVGRKDEIPNGGDYFTTTLLGEPLLVCRGKDMQIRVLSNVCRHRGNVIATEKKGARSKFTCSYHAWTYHNDGSMVNAPLMDEVSQFNKSNCRLPEFSSEIWQGFIYVNLDCKATPLAPRLSKLENMIEGYKLGDMSVCYSTEEVWPTNWKLAAENFMEGYHLSCVHKRTIHPHTPTKLCEHFEAEDAYMGYFANYPDDKPLRGKCANTLSEENRRRTTMFSVFPAHVIAVAGHVATYLCLQPLEPGKVKAKIGVLFYDAKNVSQDEIDTAVNLFTGTLEEDKTELEKLQRGLQSKYFEPNSLAPQNFEGTLWDFYHYMARNVALP